ncbi:hypothetical protein Fmac_014997 [Flemingia macrophylla]|uniref:Uncharacterized protein n=1 Tax=Flemingia macrophylla TaxID=520843 RepID=A0ABD1MDD9_9FABA
MVSSQGNTTSIETSHFNTKNHYSQGMENYIITVIEFRQRITSEIRYDSGLSFNLFFLSMSKSVPSLDGLFGTPCHNTKHSHQP